MKKFPALFANPIWASQFLKPKGFWGRLVSKVMREFNFFVYPGIEQFAGFGPNQHVLEIGFGPGTGIRYYLEKYEVMIDGIDFSSLMFKECTKRNKKFLDEGRLTLERGDFEKTSIQENCYDRVIFANVIYFWKDLESVFQKIFRTLKTNGMLVFYMSNKKLLDKNRIADSPVFIKYDITSVEEKLSATGFADINHYSILNDDNDFLIVCAKKCMRL